VYGPADDYLKISNECDDDDDDIVFRRRVLSTTTTTTTGAFYWIAAGLQARFVARTNAYRVPEKPIAVTGNDAAGTVTPSHPLARALSAAYSRETELDDRRNITWTGRAGTSVIRFRDV
jgi:hypothetical protein